VGALVKAGGGGEEIVFQEIGAGGEAEEWEEEEEVFDVFHLLFCSLGFSGAGIGDALAEDVCPEKGGDVKDDGGGHPELDSKVVDEDAEEGGE
jgi:hypothetical protein